MAKGLTYEITPKIKILEDGSLLKTKKWVCGTNAFGVNEDDDEMEYGGETIDIPPDTICFYSGDRQFIGASKTTPLSAWVRCKLIANGKVIHFTLVCERKRIWDFETFRGKKRIIQEAIDENFEILKGSEE